MTDVYDYGERDGRGLPSSESKPVYTSLWRQSFRRLLKNKLAVLGFVVVAFMFLVCFIGPMFSPYTDNKINMALMNKAAEPQALAGHGHARTGRARPACCRRAGFR